MKIFPVLLTLISQSAGVQVGSCGPLSRICLRGTPSVSSSDYLRLAAQEKNAILWKKCIQDKTSAQWLKLDGLFSESMCPTIRAQGDELPWEKGWGIFYGWRKKIVHSVGTVGQVELRNLGDHPIN